MLLPASPEAHHQQNTATPTDKAHPRQTAEPRPLANARQPVATGHTPMAAPAPNTLPMVCSYVTLPRTSSVWRADATGKPIMPTAAAEDTFEVVVRSHCAGFQTSRLSTSWRETAFRRA
jgi:hypothetical protein